LQGGNQAVTHPTGKVEHDMVMMPAIAPRAELASPAPSECLGPAPVKIAQQVHDAAENVLRRFPITRQMFGVQRQHDVEPVTATVERSVGLAYGRCSHGEHRPHLRIDHMIHAPRTVTGSPPLPLGDALRSYLTQIAG